LWQSFAPTWQNPSFGAHLLDIKSQKRLPGIAKRELGSTATNEPHLWNPIALLKVWIIGKLKPVSLEIHISKGRVDALREPSGVPASRKISRW
jgi:hypothetical protein